MEVEVILDRNSDTMKHTMGLGVRQTVFGISALPLSLCLWTRVDFLETQLSYEIVVNDVLNKNKAYESA